MSSWISKEEFIIYVGIILCIGYYFFQIPHFEERFEQKEYKVIRINEVNSADGQYTKLTYEYKNTNGATITGTYPLSSFDNVKVGDCLTGFKEIPGNQIHAGNKFTITFYQCIPVFALVGTLSVLLTKFIQIRR